MKLRLTRGRRTYVYMLAADNGVTYGQAMELMGAPADKGFWSGTVRHNGVMIPYKLLDVRPAKNRAYSLYLCADLMAEVKSLAEAEGLPVSRFVENVISAYIAKRE